MKENIHRINNRLVDFIICGAQKSGTRALSAYLRKHPHICMANKKEVHFFDSDHFFCKKQPNYSCYHKHFTPKPWSKILGETTPIYMYWNTAPRRIWKYNPNIKLIVILRNPIKRAYSHWNMARLRNKDKLDFWSAIQNEEKRCKKNRLRQQRVFSYIDRGFYANQLKRLWSYFPRRNILVIKNEYLKYCPTDCLKDVCNFLDVEHFENVTQKRVHSKPYLSEMGKKESTYLKSVFEYEIRELELLLGWDCSDWLSNVI